MRHTSLFAVAGLMALLVAPCHALPGGVQLGLRAGGAGGESQGLLIGADLRLPGLPHLSGADSRLDVDGWADPFGGGGRTSYALMYAQTVRVPFGYVGAAGGYSRITEHGTLRSGPSAKLIAGVAVPMLGAFEANWHFGKVSVVTGMMRFKF